MTNNKIYTITMVQKIEKYYINKDTWFPDFGEKRCVGYFFNLNEAIRTIKLNKHNIQDDLYNYCIVEEVPQGIYKYTPIRYLYKWENNTFIQIDEPIELQKVTNFSIG